MDSEKKALDSHKRQALVLLIGSIFDQLDEITVLRKRGHPALLSLQLLREMTSVIQDLPKELQETYFDLLVRLGSARELRRPVSISDDFIELALNTRREWVQRVKNELEAA